MHGKEILSNIETTFYIGWKDVYFDLQFNFLDLHLL